MRIYRIKIFTDHYETYLYTLTNVFIQTYFDAIGGAIEGYEVRFELCNLLRSFQSIIDTDLDLRQPLAFQSSCCRMIWKFSLIILLYLLKVELNKN